MAITDKEKAAAILGLDANAAESEIKKQYRQLMLKYHPDKNSHPLAQLKSQQVIAAYNYLMGTDKHFQEIKMPGEENKDTAKTSSPTPPPRPKQQENKSAPQNPVDLLGNAILSDNKEMAIYALERMSHSKNNNQPLLMGAISLLKRPNVAIIDNQPLIDFIINDSQMTEKLFYNLLFQKNKNNINSNVMMMKFIEKLSDNGDLKIEELARMVRSQNPSINMNNRETMKMIATLLNQNNSSIHEKYIEEAIVHSNPFSAILLIEESVKQGFTPNKNLLDSALYRYNHHYMNGEMNEVKDMEELIKTIMLFSSKNLIQRDLDELINFRLGSKTSSYRQQTQEQIHGEIKKGIDKVKLIVAINDNLQEKNSSKPPFKIPEKLISDLIEMNNYLNTHPDRFMLQTEILDTIGIAKTSGTRLTLKTILPLINGDNDALFTNTVLNFVRESGGYTADNLLNVIQDKSTNQDAKKICIDSMCQHLKNGVPMSIISEVNHSDFKDKKAYNQFLVLALTSNFKDINFNSEPNKKHNGMQLFAKKPSREDRVNDQIKIVMKRMENTDDKNYERWADKVIALAAVKIYSAKPSHSAARELDQVLMKHTKYDEGAFSKTKKLVDKTLDQIKDISSRKMKI